MKNIVFLFLLLISQLFLAQNHKIAQLLNQQLQREYTRFYSAEEKASFSVTQPFFIDENKVLHFGFTLISNADGAKTSFKRQVPLDKIVLMDKDLNIYFQTLSQDVTETRTDYYANGKVIQTKTKQTHLFSTEINKEHYPNRFMKRLVKAFKKAGYEVECNFINP